MFTKLKPNRSQLITTSIIACTLELLLVLVTFPRQPTTASPVNWLSLGGTVLLTTWFSEHYQDRPLTYSGLFLLWVENELIQVLILTFGLIFTNQVGMFQILASLFPALRNATTAVTGILLGGAFLIEFQRQHRKSLLALAIIGLLLILNFNLTGWHNPLIFAVAFVAGQLKIPSRWLTVLGWSLVTVLILFLHAPAVIGWFAVGWTVLQFGLLGQTWPMQAHPLFWALSIAQSSVVGNIVANYLAHPYWPATALSVAPIAIVLALGLVFYDHFFHWSLPTWTVGGSVRLFKRLWPYLALLILGYCEALLMQVMIEPTTKLTWYFQHTSSQTVITGLVMTSLTILFWFIIRRFWIATNLGLLITATITIIDQAKITVRQEPILPSDINLLGEAGELIKMANFHYWIVLGLIIFVLVAFTGFAEYAWPVRFRQEFTWGNRLALAFAPLFILSSWGWNTTIGDRVTTAFDDEPLFYSQLIGAKHNGPIVQFLNNWHQPLIAKPAGYSKATMQALQRRYQNQAQLINRTRTNHFQDQTVIFNLSESFANPQRMPGIQLASDPIPKIHAIQHDSTHGLMMSSGYGGGTANMEWMTLTGFNLGDFAPSLAIAYTQLLPRQPQVDTVVHASRQATAIHDYIGSFYSRITDYQRMGFKRYYYEGGPHPLIHRIRYQNSPYFEDQTAYANATKVLNQTKRPQFINLITMQNHAPYDGKWYSTRPSEVMPTKLSPGTKQNDLWNYTTGIQNTDQAVDQFIQQIKKRPEPITVVFYGDHLPGLYGNNLNANRVVMHQTDYFIYSNPAAQAKGARNLKQHTKVVGTNDLLAMTYAQTNSKVGWYQALLTQVWQQLPAMSADSNIPDPQAKSRNMLTDQHGHIVNVNHLTKPQRQLQHDYQLVEYDLTLGHHYLGQPFAK